MKLSDFLIGASEYMETEAFCKTLKDTKIAVVELAETNITTESIEVRLILYKQRQFDKINKFELMRDDGTIETFYRHMVQKGNDND